MIAGALPEASGAFETMRVYRGTPFAWCRHMDRLRVAARVLGIPLPDSAYVRGAVDEVLLANDLFDARVRVTLVAGADGAAPDVIVAASALAPSQSHARVVTASWPRNERAATAGVKSTSYAENVRAFSDARARGADEAIFANTRGELCEATGSNVFVVDHGVVRTPPPSAGCLLGVTRALVVELGAANGIPIEEVALPIRALADADEAFLTSTTREVQPISSVDGRPLPDAPGAVTARLAASYADLVGHDVDP